MTALIIEDELPAALQLERLLSAERPDLKVLEKLESVETSVRWLSQNQQPDVIFIGKKQFFDSTLEELERALDPSQFFRVSRQMTLHLKSISKIHPHLNGRLKLELSPSAGDEVFVSRARVGEFKTWLGG